MCLCESVYECVCVYVCVLLELFLATEYGLIFCATGWDPKGLLVQLYSQWALVLKTLGSMESGVRWASLLFKEIKVFSLSQMVGMSRGVGVELKKKRNCSPRDEKPLRLGWVLQFVPQKRLLCLAKNSVKLFFPN